jgi:ring-1,2-phenylacetyl-CoA epoxidase subunit PaaD
MASQNGRSDLEQQVWTWLSAVPDPEIPILSVVELGMVRAVAVSEQLVNVEVAPTYSGCPATEVIEESILTCLREKGLTNASVKRVLFPPWTTDWISAAGREKLRAYGIAPPVGNAGKRALLGKGAVHCPRCGNDQTTLVSEFGSTACKASYKCDECLEPFEYFKCI